MKSKRNAHYLEGPVRASESRIVSQVGNSFRPVLPSAQSAPRREKLGLVNATSSVARAVRGCASWTSHLLSPLACRKPIAKMWIFVVAPPTTHASNHVKAENLEGDTGQDVQIPWRRIPRGLGQSTLLQIDGRQCRPGLQAPAVVEIATSVVTLVPGTFRQEPAGSVMMMGAKCVLSVRHGTQ